VPKPELIGVSKGIEIKLRKLKEAIAKKESILVAYSGGVDSGLLAVIAHEVLKDRFRCAILDSPIIPRRTIREAQETTKKHGFSCEVVPFPVAQNDIFRRNASDRCYLCKELFSEVLKKRAQEYNLAYVADGVNLTDFEEHRPGIRASTEKGIIHPFVEVGITKANIRGIAHLLNLDFWNKPSSACLSSRIPYGEEITEDKLRVIEKAEEFLNSIGFSQVRVRVHGNIARIEVRKDEIRKILLVRENIIEHLRDCGFLYITLDLEGYRSGSMDEVL